MKKIVLGFTLLLAATGVAFADAGQTTTTATATAPAVNSKPIKSLLAADAIVVKTPQLELVSKEDNSAEVFMELDNNSNKAIALIAANSMAAMQTMLHKSIEHDGADTMKQVSKILIKAHSDADLQQGGLHVMLMGLKQALHKGDSVPILLIFKDGSSLTVHATVGQA